MGKARPDPTHARDTFWQAWENLLARLPFRNLLLVACDFNCSLDKQKSSRFKTAQYPDQDAFKAVISRFSLASVRVHDSHPSYIGPAGHSNIDYIFARRPQLDQLARQARRIRSFPIQAHREYQDHAPIACSVPMNWKAWYSQMKKPAHRLSRSTMQHMRQEWTTVTPNWNAFEDHIDHRLRQATENAEHPDSITAFVVHACCNHFSKAPEPPATSGTASGALFSVPSVRSVR